MKIQVDRILINEILAVYHSDGAVRWFMNINPKNLIVDAGETAFPVQASAIIASYSRLAAFGR